MDLREASRTGWSREKYSDTDSLTLGCMLRIADAAEVMAKNHNELPKEIKD